MEEKEGKGKEVKKEERKGKYGSREDKDGRKLREKERRRV